MDPLLPAEKSILDSMVDQSMLTLKSSQLKHYPHCNFSRGITNLTFITADECAGVAFSLALCTVSKAGYELFDHASKHENLKVQNYRCGNGSATCNYFDSNSSCSDESNNDHNANLDDTAVRIKPYNVIYVLELLLTFHAWYQKGHPFFMHNSEEKEQIQNAIKEMLEEVKTKAPHHEKSGWKLQKFHDHLHVVNDMEKYGNPMNTVNGPTEHGLIDFAKIQQKEHTKNNQFL